MLLRISPVLIVDSTQCSINIQLEKPPKKLTCVIRNLNTCESNKLEHYIASSLSTLACKLNLA